MGSGISTTNANCAIKYHQSQEDINDGYEEMNKELLNEWFIQKHFLPVEAEAISYECIAMGLTSSDDVVKDWRDKQELRRRVPPDLYVKLDRILEPNYEKNSNNGDFPSGRSEQNTDRSKESDVLAVSDGVRDLLQKPHQPDVEELRALGMDQLRLMYRCFPVTFGDELDQTDSPESQLYMKVRQLVSGGSPVPSKEDSRMAVTDLQIATSWRSLISTRSLNFSIDFTSVSRLGKTGFFPSAFVLASAYRASLTVDIAKTVSTARDSSNSFSFGLLAAPASFGGTNENPVEMTDLLGKTAGTWGLVNRKNGSASEIWDQGRKVGLAPPLREGDRLSLYVSAYTEGIETYSEDEFLPNQDNSYCHLLLNYEVIYTFSRLHEEEEESTGSFLMGVTLSSGLTFTIQPINVSSFVEEVQPSRPYTGLDSDDYFDNYQARGHLSPENVESIMSTSGRSRPEIPVPAGFPRGLSLLELPVKRHVIRDNEIETEKREECENSLSIEKEVEKKSVTQFDDDSLLCCICLSNPKCVVLMPCRHLCVCANCAEIDLLSCPICRMKVQDYLKIYV